jgi:GT2 family glycosyltransferase
MIVPIDANERTGYMPEDNFMYIEETEWCARMKEAGLSLKYLPSSVIWHRFNDGKMQGPRTVYYYNRNGLRFWYKRSAWPERGRMIWNLLAKKLPELRRAEKEAPDENLRSVFAAHRAACRDFLFGKMGRGSGY